VLDAEALNEIEAECDGDADCIKESIKGLTKINMHDMFGNDLKIEMPAAKKQKISYDLPNLTIEDEEWNTYKVPVKTPVEYPVPKHVEVPVKVPVYEKVKVPVPVKVPVYEKVKVPVPVPAPKKAPCKKP